MDNSIHDLSAALPTSIAALRELSPAATDELTAHTESMTLNAGETLFKAGQPFKNAVFILAQGKIKLTRPGESSTVLEPGYILGIANYFDSTPYLSTATALDKVTLHVLSAEKLQKAEQRHPEIFNLVNQLLTEHIRSQTGQPITGAWALPARAIMKSPLATCGPETTVKEAFTMMNRRRMGSLGVIDSPKGLQGLVTFVTLAEGMITKQAKPHDNVSKVCEIPRTIDSATPLWKVQNEQLRLGAKYLIVMEETKPVGIISQTDVLYALVSYQRSLSAQVGEIESFDELRAFSDRIGQLAGELRQNNRSAGMAVRALSEIHLAVQRRCIELVLQQLDKEGQGTPPVPFAFIIMGSGGRKEMIIRTDQDNGIILADTAITSNPETRSWFMDFCDRVNHRLDEVGYEWCTGNIMARNPDFHKSLSEWKQHLSRIAEIPTEKSARWSTIFFDFDTLYGDDRLTVALRNHLFEELKRKPRLLKLMVQDDATGTPAIGLFNRLITASDKERKGKIDLKRNGTRILADAARIYALSQGIDATNTGDRFTALVHQGRLDSGFVESILAAYDELLDLTLGHQLHQWQQGIPLDKLIDPNELTPLEEESLRIAMRIAKHLQGRIQGEFGTVML